ncbi:MAG: hypothetical protein Q9227_007547 [Pyrenula ochraceoflavens]
MSSESPRSDRVQTRFSTPVPELDDHRFQLGSLPEPDVMLQDPGKPSRVRNGSQNYQVQSAVRDSGLMARDFEHEQAIVDDDRSIEHEIVGPGKRKDSLSPTMLRHPTNRRSRNNHERPAKSRASSSSSSTSPPNSVEAFADPRRRERANTLESKIPSDLDLIRHRSDSIVEAQHRPPVTPGSVARETKKEDDGPGQDDVCFSSFEEPGKTYTIDYEELEEFVALKKDTPLKDLHRNIRRESMSRAPRTFHDIRRANRETSFGRKSSGPTDSFRPSSYLLTSPNGQKRVSDEDLNEKIPLEHFPAAPKAPERFAFFSSETTSITHATDLADLIGDGVTFRDLFEVGPEGGVFWLDIINPTEEEYIAIAKAFKIHPLTYEDILAQEPREKVELFPHYYFVSFRTFYQMDKRSEDYLEPFSVYIVVFREGVLSFSFSDHPHARSVRNRLSQLRDYMALGSDWICYAMM